MKTFAKNISLFKPDNLGVTRFAQYSAHFMPVDENATYLETFLKSACPTYKVVEFSKMFSLKVLCKEK